MTDFAKMIGINEKLFKLLDIQNNDEITNAYLSVLPDILEILGAELDVEDLGNLAKKLRDCVPKDENSGPISMTFEEAVDEYRDDDEERIRLKGFIPQINERIVTRVFQEI